MNELVREFESLNSGNVSDSYWTGFNRERDEATAPNGMFSNSSFYGKFSAQLHTCLPWLRFQV